MIGTPRLRRLAPLGLAAVLALALAACGRVYPNTTFQPHSDLGRSIDFLWGRLFFLGTLVFVLVEFALIYVVWRYRRRSEDIVPPQTHGNVVLEITWTLIPAAILAFIAVPTVRTIFETQAKAPATRSSSKCTGTSGGGSSSIPQYNITTANEIYIPKGRTVDLVLQTRDVHALVLGTAARGEARLIANHVNHIWFTPDRNMPTQCGTASVPSTAATRTRRCTSVSFTVIRHSSTVGSRCSSRRPRSTRRRHQQIQQERARRTRPWAISRRRVATAPIPLLLQRTPTRSSPHPPAP